MNKDQFMNAVGKQAEAVTPPLSRECVEYIVIHAIFTVHNGFWKYYNTGSGVKKLIEMLSDSFLSLCGTK